MALTRPKRVGNYQLIYPIGQGGLAEVYLALQNGRPFAVKCLKPERAVDPRFVRDFTREAKISTTLDHPNILRFLDQGKAGDTYFAVMELLVGSTLDTLLTEARSGREPLPLSFFLYCIAELCKALRHLHQKTVFEFSNSVLFHGDISPTNIMVAQDGRVLLMDFGSAGQQSETYPKDHHLGKMYYLPADVLKKEPYTTATDIYSLGVLAFYLIFGQRPFEEDQPGAFSNILRTDIPRPDCSKIARTLKEEGPIRIFFNKALHKDPKLRFATVDEFEKAFLSLHFSQATPKNPGEFLSQFPTWLTERLNATASDWMRRIREYRAGEVRLAESATTPEPVESLLAQINRRRHPRLLIQNEKIEAEILAMTERTKVKAPLAELSRGGMLVAWQGLTSRVGSDYPLKFRLDPKTAPITATGRMLYEVQRKAKPYAAFQFVELSPENDLRLVEFVSSRMPTMFAPKPVAQENEAGSPETYVDVIFRSFEDFQKEFETNIRNGGMFIQSDRAYENDSVVLIRIQIGNQLERVTLTGRAVYCRPIESTTGGGLRFGVGLQLAVSPARLAEIFAQILPKTH